MLGALSILGVPRDTNTDPWQNLPQNSQDSGCTAPGVTMPEVCSNLTTHQDHLMVIGSRHRHSYDHTFFVYSFAKSQWLAVADVPRKESSLDVHSQQKPRNTHMVRISANEILLLGEVFHRDFVCRISFQSKHYSIMYRYLFV